MFLWNAEGSFSRTRKRAASETARDRLVKTAFCIGPFAAVFLSQAGPCLTARVNAGKRQAGSSRRRETRFRKHARWVRGRYFWALQARCCRLVKSQALPGPRCQEVELRTCWGDSWDPAFARSDGGAAGGGDTTEGVTAVATTQLFRVCMHTCG